MPKLPKPLSPGEETFALHCKAYGLTPEREYLFAKGHRYCFDFAWPDKMVALEVEGGVWSKGRHTRPEGFIDDCNKYNLATSLGWSVYRFPTDQVLSGVAIDFILDALDMGHLIAERTA